MSDATSTPGNGHASGSHYQPSLGVVLAIVVLFVGATFLMVRSVSPSTAATATTTTTTSTTSGTTPPHIVKSRVSVQVANGTNISQLAAHYTQLLTTQNWDTLPADNGPSEKATVIYFKAGFQAAAQEVASAIHVNSTDVRPLGKAVPVTGAQSDDVIVILGPNAKASST
jgi:LytR cell envelope-related transcriptional attenuator